MAFYILVFGAFIAVGTLLYGHTLSFPFVFDDQLYLLNNPLLKDARSFSFHGGDFSSFATYAERNGLDRDLSTNFILRPVAYLTFHLNYLLGDLNPRAFRAVNIALHCANACLLFLLLSLLCRASPKQTTLPPLSATFIALTTSLIFLVHPLHTESVTYIIQRFTSLATFFYLIALLTYFLAGNPTWQGFNFFWRAISLVSLILGMLSKEMVFTAPLLIVLLDWLVMGTPVKSALHRARLHLLCLPIIPTLIVLTAWAQSGEQFSLHATTHVAAHATPPGYQYHYALTEFRVVLEYLRLLLVPVGLNLDPDYPLSTTARDPRVVFSVLLIVGIVGAACRWRWRRPDDLRVSLGCGSVLWYFLTFAVSSSIIPLPDVMAEHRAYLPSIGVLTALVCGLDWLRTRWTSRPVLQRSIILLVVAWVAALGVATRARNEVWRSEVSLWSDAVAKSPNKARPWFNLGGGHLREGDLEGLIRCMWKVIEIAPSEWKAWNDLTSALCSLGRYKECLEASHLGIYYAPNNSSLLYNIGYAHAGLENYEKSNELMETIIAVDPNFANAHIALGVNHAMMRQYDKALHHLRKAATLQPLAPKARQLVSQIETIVQDQTVALRPDSLR